MYAHAHVEAGRMLVDHTTYSNRLQRAQAHVPITIICANSQNVRSRQRNSATLSALKQLRGPLTRSAVN